MCLFHDWDNKECRWPSLSNALMPDNKLRTCKKCGGKQVWKDYPLHIAMQTDQAFGCWEWINEYK